MANYNGGAGNDSFNVGAEADIIVGGNGTDSVSYSNSNQGINVDLRTGQGQGGDASGDTLTGIEVLTGSSLDDTLLGASGNNTLDGGAGTDSVWGMEGHDFLHGRAGNDSMMGGDGEDCLWGGQGNDWLYGGNGNDLIEAGTGDDHLWGGSGWDVFVFGANDGFNRINDFDPTRDRISVEQFAANYDFFDVSISVQGDSTLVAFAGTEIFIDNIAPNQILEEHFNFGADFPQGGVGSQTFNAIDGAQNTFCGGDGGDILNGGSGHDTASYWNSNAAVDVNLATNTVSGGHAQGDTLSSIEGVVGSAHNDQITGNAADNIFHGGAGDDTMEGGAGSDELFGGAGFDTCSYSNSTSAINVNLASNVALGGDAQGDTFSSIEGIIGSSQNDFIVGTGGGEILNGGNGSDTIEGGFGADNLLGGAGTDCLSYSGSNLGVIVNLAANTASGGDAEGDIISGFESVIGSAQNDVIVGESGANAMVGGAGTDSVWGLDGDDFLYGESGDDTLMGGTGVDTMEGGIGVDWLYGEDGNDTIIAGNGDDNLWGGVGFDIFKFDNSDGSNQINDFKLGIDKIEFDVSSFSFSDVVVADLGGSALITFGETELVLNGVNAGILTSESFVIDDDPHTFIGNVNGEQLTGSGAAETFVGGGGADVIKGGAGIDIASYWNSGAAVTIDLSTTTGTGVGGDAQGDQLTGIEEIIGSSFDDTITGSAGNNFFEGGAGDDTIDGGAGSDFLCGGAGGDVLRGGAGTDVVTYWNSELAVTVDLAAGVGVNGDAAGDTYSGIESVIGSENNDTIFGEAGANSVVGGRGSDSIFGQGGDDYLFGQEGNDSISGGAGNDTMSGGNGIDSFWAGGGSDVMTGGSGGDWFIFESGDDTNTITDFEIGSDILALGSGAATFADLTLTQNGAGATVISFSNVQLLLEGIDAASISADSFAFI